MKADTVYTDVLWAGHRGVLVFVSRGTEIQSLTARMPDGKSEELKVLEKSTFAYRFSPPSSKDFYCDMFIETVEGVYEELNVEDVTCVWPVRYRGEKAASVTTQHIAKRQKAMLKPSVAPSTQIVFVDGSVDAVDMLETIQKQADDLKTWASSEDHYVFLVEWTSGSGMCDETHYADCIASAVEAI